MSRQQVERLYYDCTLARLEDELVLILSSNKTVDVMIDDEGEGETLIYIHHPYLSQAEGLLHHINVYETPPEFVIWEDDIPEGLIQALKRQGEIAMKRIITDAVRRLYESVNPEYFHTNGIYGKVRWTFGKSRK